MHRVLRNNMQKAKLQAEDKHYNLKLRDKKQYFNSGESDVMPIHILYLQTISQND
uniref:Uncharacterized protein n=1 Tax=Arion vulgaris TaxID=1028688 RepID=A0A0B6Z0B7_9EUPU